MAEIRRSMDLLGLMSDFDTDIECRTFLEELRWPKGPQCPRCKSMAISRITKRKMFDCDGCRYQFSVTAGTLFHDSHLPLPKWFLAIFLMCESKKGMSANRLKRMLKVSYKTAWYLCHRIRAAMTELNPTPLEGTVEIDARYIGNGLGQGAGNRDRHTMILAAVQRGGQTRMTKRRKKHETREEVNEFINTNISRETPNIYTGESGAPFSLFKRSIAGSFHQLSPKHLDRYLDEFEFRYNNRRNKYMFRDVLMRLMDAKAMPYDKLTA